VINPFFIKRWVTKCYRGQATKSRRPGERPVGGGNKDTRKLYIDGLVDDQAAAICWGPKYPACIQSLASRRESILALATSGLVPGAKTIPLRCFHAFQLIRRKKVSNIGLEALSRIKRFSTHQCATCLGHQGQETHRCQQGMPKLSCENAS
jgi:hypothetical protein